MIISKKFFAKTLMVLATLFFVGGLFFYTFRVGAEERTAEVKENLKGEIAQIEQQIQSYRSRINDLKKQEKTLKRETDILENQIQKTRLQIRETDLIIAQTEQGIRDKIGEISKIEFRVKQLKSLLAESLRYIYQYSQESLLEIVLQKDSLADFFQELNAFQNIQVELKEDLADIKQSKVDLEKEQKALEEKKAEENQLKALQEIQRRALEKQQTGKMSLLSQTKGQESNFQDLIMKARGDIQAIKNQIYLLEGVGLSMTLEKALGHALFAAQRTGVRSAFLLAVLKKESSWGTNVGSGNWRKDMSPKQHQAFLDVCAKLGVDPDKMPVSRKPYYGWGGAMGPAQFLPATWLFYEAEVSRLTGHNPADPWNIDDAFTAAALKLAKAGANQQTFDAEWRAAMIYFAGGNWSKSIYRFYGDQVMELAEVIQEQLDLIEGKK